MDAGVARYRLSRLSYHLPESSPFPLWIRGHAAHASGVPPPFPRCTPCATHPVISRPQSNPRFKPSKPDTDSTDYLVIL